MQTTSKCNTAAAALRCDCVRIHRCCAVVVAYTPRVLVPSICRGWCVYLVCIISTYQPSVRLSPRERGERRERQRREKSAVLENTCWGAKRGALWGPHCRRGKGYVQTPLYIYLYLVPGAGDDADPARFKRFELRAIARSRRQNQLSKND